MTNIVRLTSAPSFCTIWRTATSILTSTIEALLNHYVVGVTIDLVNLPSRVSSMAYHPHRRGVPHAHVYAVTSTSFSRHRLATRRHLGGPRFLPAHFVTELVMIYLPRLKAFGGIEGDSAHSDTLESERNQYRNRSQRLFIVKSKRYTSLTIRFTEIDTASLHHACIHFARRN